MKFTALIREVVTRDIRMVINADSKGQCKRLLTSLAAYPENHKYREGLVVSRVLTLAPVIESIEPLTANSFR